MTVDVQRAHAADAFAAVMVEHDGFFVVLDQLVVEDIQHFQKRGVGGDVFNGIVDELPLRVGVLLTPYL